MSENHDRSRTKSETLAIGWGSPRLCDGQRNEGKELQVRTGRHDEARMHEHSRPSAVGKGDAIYLDRKGALGRNVHLHTNENRYCGRFATPMLPAPSSRDGSAPV